MDWRKYYNYFAIKVRFLPIIRNYPWLRQFIKFSIAGGVCTVIDFLIYIFLTRFSSFWQNRLIWANFLSICLSATINFVWNKKWTFGSRGQAFLSQYAKFWVVVIGGIILYQGIFIFLIRNFKFFDLFSKIIAALIVWILRFICNKFWTFR
jgi:putative flippase GtrA